MNSSTEQLSSQEHRRCLIALVAGLSFLSISSGLSWPLLSESLRLLGHDEKAIGLGAAAQFAGIMFAALLVPKVLPRFGFFKCSIFGLVVAVVSLLALPTIHNYETWLVLRFIFGVGQSLTFTIGDNWVNQVVEDRVRGRWMGIYRTAGLVGWTVGPVLGSWLNPESMTPFIVGGGTMLAAGVLLIPSRRLDVRLTPATGHSVASIHMLMAVLTAPMVLLSAALVGVIEGGWHSFGHLYTMDVVGSEYRSVGYAMIWVGAASGIFSQYPAGLLADKFNRGWLMIIFIAVMVLVIGLLPLTIAGAAYPWWTPAGLAFWAVICLWGGSLAAADTVAITLLGERFKGVGLVTANAAFSVLFGVGGMIGPSLVGATMDRVGPGGFPGSLVLVAFAFWLFALYRQSTRSRRQ